MALLQLVAGILEDRSLKFCQSSIIAMGAETRSNTKEMGEIRGLKGRFDVTHIGTLLL